MAPRKGYFQSQGRTQRRQRRTKTGAQQHQMMHQLGVAERRTFLKVEVGGGKWMGG